MSKLSDDESSDSSDEFLVPAHQIDLNSSFFKQSTVKSNLTTTKNSKKVPVVEEKLSDDDEDSDDEYSYSNVSSADLLSEVLKNLKKAENQSLEANSNKSELTISTVQNSTNVKDDLFKEIDDLLLQGEGASISTKESRQNPVKNEPNAESKTDYVIPEKGLQIHLPGQNYFLDKKKKKQQDLQKMLQNKINQRIRTTQVFVHKVGLLCWLAHGFFLNKLANDAELLTIAMSLVSSNNYPKERPDLKYIERFTKWFGSLFKIYDEHKEILYSKDILIQRVSEKKIYNNVELVLLYVATLRGMGVNCRLVISLQPPPLKPKSEQLFKIEKNDENNTKIVKKETAKKMTVKTNYTRKPVTVVPQSKQKGVKNKSVSKEKLISPSKDIPKNSLEGSKLTNLEARKKAAAILKSPIDNASSTTNKTEEIKNIDQSKVESPLKTQRVILKYTKNMGCSDDDESDLEKKQSIADKLKNFTRSKNLKKDKSKANIANNKAETKSTITKVNKNDDNSFMSSDEENSGDESNFSVDEDYVEKKPKKRVAKPAYKRQTVSSKFASKYSNQRKLLSSDEEDGEIRLHNSNNFWVEVYVESEESWICVSITDQKIHCSSEIFRKASSPVLYVVAWNSTGTLKDVTRRYCPHWLTDTRKKRVDEKWWSETLSFWKEKKTAISKAEDEQLLLRELEQPLPKTVGDCKGHPLYVLTRHLLKFEALYPPDCVPLGHLKTGEAIYSRHCVHTLCSRETWLKKARVVKPAQESYKIVKSLPKFDKLSGMKIKDQPLELFGKWQTNPYEPPEAKDGIVPRNEYGNVDLFKMSMLPKKTVYLNLPGLNRVARKLNIDCAPACVGFNFGCRGALPAFEGFVVCEEYEDTVREAWEEEQINAEKRAKEKREKRIYGNWKKLIKGLLIRVKLSAKYNFGEDEDVNYVNNRSCTNDNLKSIAKSTKKCIQKEKISHVDPAEPSTSKKKTTTAKKNVRSSPKHIFSDEEDDEEDEKNKEKVETIKKKISIFKKLTIKSSTSQTNAKNNEKQNSDRTETEESHQKKKHISTTKNFENKSDDEKNCKTINFLKIKNNVEGNSENSEVDDKTIKDSPKLKKKSLKRTTNRTVTKDLKNSKDDSDAEEFAPPKKRLSTEEANANTKRETRSSKRNKQEPGNVNKKIKK